MELVWFLVFFYMQFFTFGYGFLFDTSTPLTQIHGQSTPDKNNAALYELLLDEKRHRMELEQRVKAVETQTGYKEQNRKLEQLSNYVLQLEKEIQNLKMQCGHEVPKNETIDSVARAHILDLSSLMENKYQALSHNNNDLLTKQHTIEQTVTDLKRNISDITQLKGINQIQLLDTLRKRVDSVESQSNQIISNANARGQDVLALYNKTIFVETDLQTKILNVERNLTMTLNLQIRNLSYELEHSKNISAMNLSTHIAKEEASLQNIVKKMKTENEKHQQIINVSLSQLDSRLDSVYQDLNATTKALKSRTKKVALSSCMTTSNTYNSGQVVPFSRLQSIVGINKLTQFLPNGTFICEDAGLYIITITMATVHSYTSQIGIFKNDLKILEFYDSSSAGEHTASGVVTAEIKKKDKIYVKTLASTYLYSSWSCLTIVKIA